MEILAESHSSAIIKAALASIDLTHWLFNLTDSEYRACSPSHIAGGSSVTEDGARISINVELIAGNLLVQHYMEDISQRDHCRVNSISDSISPAGKSALGITWELSLEKINDTACKLVNHVIVHLTSAFAEQLRQAGVADMTLVKQGMKENLDAHNTAETPFFAADIEKKALAGKWI